MVPSCQDDVLYIHLTVQYEEKKMVCGRLSYSDTPTTITTLHTVFFISPRARNLQLESRAPALRAPHYVLPTLFRAMGSFLLGVQVFVCVCLCGV